MNFKLEKIIMGTMLVSVTLIFSTLPQAVSQDNAPSFDSDSLCYWESETIWCIDPTSLEETVFFNYSHPEDVLITSMKLTTDVNQLYVLELDTSVSNLRHVVQVDVESATRRVIWEGGSLQELYVSPSGEKIILFSIVRTSGDSRTEYCVLSVSTSECLDIDVDGYDVHWIDDVSFAYVTFRGTIGLVNTESLNQEEYEVSGLDFQYIEVIDRSKTILGNVNFREFVFWDISTRQLTQVAHQIVTPGPIWRMNTSPDGRFLSYFRSNQLVVVTVESGEYFVLDIDSVIEEWFPKYPGLIGFSRSGENQEVLMLVYVDVATGSVQELGEHSQQIRFTSP